MIQRALSIALSLAAVALSAVLAFKSAPGVAASQEPSAAPRDGGAAALTAAAHADAGNTDGGDLSLPSLFPPLDVGDGAPHAATGAPRHVRFGVVLVTYAGAEAAPATGARPKPEALSLATRLADEARGEKSDFHSVVQRGDSGSADDVGEVKRGDLEPEPEAVLFALPVGGVSGVIDTPRGFWIVKRLE